MVSLVIHSRGHMQGQAFFQLVHREVRPQKHGASVVKRSLLKDFVSVQSKRMLFREDLRETFFNFVGNFIYYWPSVLSFVFDYYSRVSNNHTYQACNFEFCTMYGQIKMSHSIHICSIQIDTGNLYHFAYYARWNHHKSFELQAPLTFWVFDIFQASNWNLFMKYQLSDHYMFFKLFNFIIDASLFEV